MKNLFFLFAFVCYASTAAAQLTKGHWLVGGNGSFYDEANRSLTSATTGSNYINFDISASIGYFVMDKLALGLKPAFSSVKGGEITGGTVNTQTYWLGPFGRYYLLDKKKHCNILIDASYQFGTNSFNWKQDEDELRTFSLLVGPVIYFNSSVGVECLMGYKYSLYDTDAIIDTRHGLQISIGLQINLKK